MDNKNTLLFHVFFSLVDTDSTTAGIFHQIYYGKLKMTSTRMASKVKNGLYCGAKGKCVYGIQCIGKMSHGFCCVVKHIRANTPAAIETNVVNKSIGQSRN